MAFQIAISFEEHSNHLMRQSLQKDVVRFVLLLFFSPKTFESSETWLHKHRSDWNTVAYHVIIKVKSAIRELS